MAADIVILGIVFVYGGYVVVRRIKNRKRSGAGCSGCGGSCRGCK